MQQAGQGRIHLWEGGSLWTGRWYAATQAHSHYAIQIALALSGSLSLRTSGADWRPYQAVLIPSLLPHALDAQGASVALLFVEPESAQGRALLARFGGQAPAELSAAALAPYIGRLQAAEGAAPKCMLDSARTLIGALAGTGPAVAFDARIARSLRFLADRLEVPPALSEVAASVHLSPGRFRHLFVQQTGQSFRSYLLWLRLKRALEILGTGATATGAAHAAGFADAAHLSRTFRRMLGIAPASLKLD